MHSNSQQRFNLVAKILHWSCSTLILFNLVLGISLDITHLKFLHIQIGLLILLLVCIRIFWRLTSTYPDKIHTVPKWEIILAQILQFALYLLMILIPVSGILMVQAKGHVVNIFNLIDITTIIHPQQKIIAHQYKEIHEFLAYLLLGLVGIHVLGAFKNHFIYKNQVLKRMFV